MFANVYIGINILKNFIIPWYVFTLQQLGTTKPLLLEISKSINIELIFVYKLIVMQFSFIFLSIHNASHRRHVYNSYSINSSQFVC